MKYVDTFIGLREIPDEITLCINISNCPLTCENCHSSYLRQNIGNELTTDTLKELLDQNSGISCVCFMGHEGLTGINFLNDVICPWIKQNYNIKIGVYSGFDLELKYPNFDFIKTGKYDQNLGALDFPTTNQRFYKNINGNFYDFTYIFWLNSNIEIWKDIPDYPGYQASTLGNIRSLNYMGRGYIKEIKASKSGPKRGYLSVSLRKSGKTYRRNVHRLVATTFIPNPYNLPEINHKDENGLNNSINNLEWCDRLYNLSYGSRVQKFIDAKSKPILQYDLSGNFIKEWKSQTEISRVLKVDLGSLQHCLAGYRIKKGKHFIVKSYHGYIWKYK